jgi:2-amino-4-hydroxy-6-hydroxymethyldihydropteridine diphosphokinase
MPKAYIGLGANLGDPAAQIRVALEGLRAQSLSLRCSSFYRTAPIGEAGQPDYCNVVCEIETRIAAQPLMRLLLALEREAGRVRDGRRWAARRLDLDLLHYEGVQMDTPELKLPHPEIARRNFVLVPLAELAPALEIPGVGRVGALALQSGRAGLDLWAE